MRTWNVCDLRGGCAGERSGDGGHDQPCTGGRSSTYRQRADRHHDGHRLWTVGTNRGEPTDQALRLQAHVRHAHAHHLPSQPTCGGGHEPGVVHDHPRHRLHLHRRPSGGHLHPYGVRVDRRGLEHRHGERNAEAVPGRGERRWNWCPTGHRREAGPGQHGRDGRQTTLATHPGPDADPGSGAHTDPDPDPDPGPDPRPGAHAHFAPGAHPASDAGRSSTFGTKSRPRDFCLSSGDVDLGAPSKHRRCATRPIPGPPGNRTTPERARDGQTVHFHQAGQRARLPAVRPGPQPCGLQSVGPGSGPSSCASRGTAQRASLHDVDRDRAASRRALT